MSLKSRLKIGPFSGQEPLEKSSLLESCTTALSRLETLAELPRPSVDYVLDPEGLPRTIESEKPTETLPRQTNVQ